MAKENGSKRRGKLNVKALIIVFAVICVVVTGVVLGVTYWPSNSAEVSNYFKAYNISISGEGDNSINEQKVAVEKFITSHGNSFTEKGKGDYKKEMDVYNNVISASTIISGFYTINFDGLISDSISMKDAKKVDSGLETCRSSIKKMGDYIIAHEDEMTNFTVVCASWESIRGYNEEFIRGWNSVNEAINNLLQKNLRGVYGNQKLKNVAEATEAYTEVILDQLYEKEGYVASSKAFETSTKFLNFVESYYQDDTQLISNYYIDKTIQDQADVVANLTKTTEEKVNLEYLISNSFEYENLALSAQQKTCVATAVNFLKGGV